MKNVKKLNTGWVFKAINEKLKRNNILRIFLVKFNRTFMMEFHNTIFKFSTWKTNTRKGRGQMWLMFCANEKRRKLKCKVSFYGQEFKIRAQ